MTTRNKPVVHFSRDTNFSLVLIENRNQLINPEESIESDIAHHLKNLSYGTDIQGRPIFPENSASTIFQKELTVIITAITAENVNFLV